MSQSILLVFLVFALAQQYLVFSSVDIERSQWSCSLLVIGIDYARHSLFSAQDKDNT